MKKITAFTAIVLVTLFLLAGVSQALILGDNITIGDGMPSAGVGVGSENNECEDGMVQSQVWDLEGFFLQDNNLTMVGGYDFESGVSEYTSGDIFIDVTGDVQFGGSDDTSASDGNTPIKNTFGYDYVLDIDFSNNSYSIFSIDSSNWFESVFYNNLNAGSNPWQYHNNWTVNNQQVNTETSIFSGSLNFYDGNEDDGINDAAKLEGLVDWDNINYNDIHYGATFDISIILDTLTAGKVVTFHNTMGCGNDNLMGQMTTVPEPATIILMCAGLLGLVGVRRIRK